MPKLATIRRDFMVQFLPIRQYLAIFLLSRQYLAIYELNELGILREVYIQACYQ
jgi:hypothetical protein